MKVLVTGVAGLLGSRFADWILRNVPDATVLGIDDCSCGYPENVPAGVRWLNRSLGRGGLYGQVLEEEIGRFAPDLIYHFAAYAAEGLSPFVRCYNYRNNLVATAQLINCALELGTVRRFVYTSSMAVYGAGRPPFHEDLPRQPIDPYGVAKAAAEQDLEIAGRQHGLDWTIIRPHNVYGEHQSIWQRYRNVLGIWMARHLAGEPLLIYGDGTQTRAFSFVDDCLPALWQAGVRPEAGRQIINLGGTRPRTIRRAAEMVCDVMGGGTIRHVEPRHEVRYAWSTWQKSVDLLDYADCTGFREGLERMWRWARQAWDQFPERRGTSDQIPIEVRRGLYPFWQTPASPAA